MKKSLLCIATVMSVVMMPLGVFAAELNGTTNSTANATNNTNGTNTTNTTVNATAQNKTTENKTVTINGTITLDPVNSTAGVGNKTIYFAPSDAKAEIGSVVIDFKMGKKIEDFKCNGNSDWTVKQVSNSDGSITCTFSAKNSKKVGAKLTLGMITFNNAIEENDTDEDCAIYATFKGATGEIVPDTGASLPYIVLLGGILLAGAVYTTTNKKTKFNRI